MVVAFLESIKYVGHLLPVSLLRIYMGYYYLREALLHLEGEFLHRPDLAAQISEWLPQAHVADWYRQYLEDVVIPNWQTFSYVLLGSEFIIGISFLFGYFVRPVSVLGLFLAVNLLYISSPEKVELYRLFTVIHLTLGWLGAGRCLGFDYYFFKRRRGLWW